MPPHHQNIKEGGAAFIYGYLSNSNGDITGIDFTTRVLTTIDYGHHEIHAGSHFILEL